MISLETCQILSVWIVGITGTCVLLFCSGWLFFWAMLLWYDAMGRLVQNSVTTWQNISIWLEVQEKVIQPRKQKGRADEP